MKQILIIGIGFVLLATLMAFGINPITEPLPEIKVAVYFGSGSLDLSTSSIQSVMASFSDIRITPVTERDIREGALNRVHALIMPDGSDKTFHDALGADGCRAIERFVSNGGGYVGIGAGTCLAALGYDEHSDDLELINARIAGTSDGMNGTDMMLCAALTRQGSRSMQFEIQFNGGPVLVPGEEHYLQPYATLAKFNGEAEAPEISEGGIKGGDAIVASRFGQGRVILFSPNPEMTPGMENCLARALRWAAGKCEPGTAALGPEFSWEGIFGIPPSAPQPR